MSRRRYLSTDISTDRRVNQMGMKYGDGPVLFYTWLIPHCDDEGTITADPWELLGIVWAARRDKTEDDVRQAIAACEEFGLLTRTSDGQRLQFPLDSWLAMQPALRRYLVDPTYREFKAQRKRILAFLLTRDGAMCRYCSSTGPLEVDHIIPLSKGGSNDMGNLQLLCRPCNRQKSNKLAWSPKHGAQSLH